MNDQSDNKKDDAQLFREAMRGVTPLKHDNRVPLSPIPKKPPKPRYKDVLDEQQRFSQGMIDDECPDQLYFERPGGVQKAVLKKLRNGKLAIDDILDLHGLTASQASTQLTAFLQECHQLGHRHVIIVHGKGYRSTDRAVIKPLVNRWLRQADEVLAFSSAQPKDGGTGAVYVLLRKTSDQL
jgi:DNA-nicking Smr family endonuclease